MGAEQRRLGMGSMRVLYVYCHPLPESFHAAIRKEALAGLKAAGHEVDLLDLYAENFDPVLIGRGAAALSRCSREPRRARDLYRSPDCGRGDGDAVSDLVLRHAGDAQGILRPAHDAGRRLRPLRPGACEALAREPAPNRRRRDLRPAVVHGEMDGRPAAKDGDALPALVHRRTGQEPSITRSTT